MAGLYPNLHERFKTEGICPICLFEMGFTARYSCSNGHTICHHCQPHYHLCPTCGFKLNLDVPRNNFVYPSYSTMPHPVQIPDHQPTAPPMTQDFLRHEVQNNQLSSCAYTRYGCWIKFPAHLKNVHESRCQFRPGLEDHELPTDINTNQNELVDCTNRPFGCQMKILPWRKHIHESYCSYKNQTKELSDDFQSWTIVDNPEGLVDCDYRIYGCRVRMPRGRKYSHQQVCNYKRDDRVNTDRDYPMPTPSPRGFDPEEILECKWSRYGCRVNMKRSRKEIHEENCNYKMLECIYKDYGCNEVFEPSRKFAHESRCDYAC